MIKFTFKCFMYYPILFNNINIYIKYSIAQRPMKLTKLTDKILDFLIFSCFTNC